MNNLQACMSHFSMQCFPQKEGKMKNYTGPLDNEVETPDLVKKAYQSWLDQRKRCYNKKSKSYKWYGAKGIKQEYSSREFVNWYLSQIKLKKYKRPVIGRIDHSGNYKFDNIEIQESADNAREMLNRVGHEICKKKSKPISILDKQTGALFMIVASRKDAEKITGVSAANIWCICKGLTAGSRSGFTFRYTDESKN